MKVYKRNGMSNLTTLDHFNNVKEIIPKNSTIQIIRLNYEDNMNMSRAQRGYDAITPSCHVFGIVSSEKLVKHNNTLNLFHNSGITHVINFSEYKYTIEALTRLKTKLETYKPDFKIIDHGNISLREYSPSRIRSGGLYLDEHFYLYLGVDSNRGHRHIWLVEDEDYQIKERDN